MFTPSYECEIDAWIYSWIDNHESPQFEILINHLHYWMESQKTIVLNKIVNINTLKIKG